MGKFYVIESRRRGQVVAYMVCDRVGGLESCHAQYRIGEPYTADVAKHLAEVDASDRNEGVA